MTVPTGENGAEGVPFTSELTRAVAESGQRATWVPSLRDPSAPTSAELMAGVEIGEIVGDGIEPGDVVNVYPATDGLGNQGWIVQFVPARSEPPQRRDVADDETGDVVSTWVYSDGSPADFGPVEWSLRRDLGQIKASGQLSGTLIASATALAQAMDRATPDKIAGIGRELREHIRQIEEQAGDNDDTKSHRAGLSTPV